uniref:Uncharacterized protein n=1 Tax=Timema poppense TaxID=170557 RepID=A0A7R9DPB6_TIMPO|nr:unnamed protein product [Timema poppensis]
MSRLRGVSVDKLHDELDDLCQVNKTDGEAKESWTIASIARAPNLRLPLLLVCALSGRAAVQRYQRCKLVFYYSVSIFESAGLSHDGSQYASIGAGGVNLLIAIISIPLVNCYGRRGLALWSCATAAFFLIMLCICITYINSFSWMPYLCIFTVLAYVFCYGFGLGPIPYFIGSGNLF